MRRRTFFCLILSGALLLTGCGAPGEADATTPAPTVSSPPSESSAAAQTTSPSTPATSTQSGSVSTPATAAEQTSAAPESDPVSAETTLADPWTRLVDEWRTKTLPLEAGEDGRLVAEFVAAYFAAFEHLTPEDSPFAYSDSAVLSFMLPQVVQERIPETGENALLLIAPVRYAIHLYESSGWAGGGYEQGEGEYEGWIITGNDFVFTLDENRLWRYSGMGTGYPYIDWGQPWHEFE